MITSPQDDSEKIKAIAQEADKLLQSLEESESGREISKQTSSLLQEMKQPVSDHNKDDSYCSSSPFVIPTPGHFVELDLASNVLQQRCRLNSIAFQAFTIILEFTYSNNKFASSCPREIDKEAILGWTGDSARIEIILHTPKTKCVLIKPAGSSENRLVDVARQLMSHNIRFIQPNKRVDLEKDF